MHVNIEKVFNIFCPVWQYLTLVQKLSLNIFVNCKDFRIAIISNSGPLFRFTSQNKSKLRATQFILQLQWLVSVILFRNIYQEYSRSPCVVPVWFLIDLKYSGKKRTQTRQLMLISKVIYHAVVCWFMTQHSWEYSKKIQHWQKYRTRIYRYCMKVRYVIKLDGR